MLTLPYIHSHKDQIIEKLRIKNFDALEIMNRIIETDNSRKGLQTSADRLQNTLNEKSK